MLAPIEEAQHEIHNSAKHAQWLSEVIVYYHDDHKMNARTAHELLEN